MLRHDFVSFEFTGWVMIQNSQSSNFRSVEKNGARRDTEPNNNRRNSSQYNRRNTRFVE